MADTTIDHDRAMKRALSLRTSRNGESGNLARGYIEAQEYREYYKVYLVRLKKICPCGGVILADTEDFEVPLCIDCFSEQEQVSNG